jgi:hypothetical protein
MTLVLDGTNNTYLSATERGQLMTLSTAQATTSGTSIDFTSIPTWAKRITVIFNGVSTNGTSEILLRIGSGSVETTVYVSASQQGATALSSTAGYIISRGLGATSTLSGSATLRLIGSNIWTSSSVVADTTVTTVMIAGGSKTLSGTLDRVRLTTVNGTDTFDAGSVNILIEGSL